ncbi:reverse transcriptase [compost metagenome]
MDVSKCFDSIYTHSISWATKDKQYTKQNLQVSSTFGDNFDSLIRRANQNETNGILIGPEVSRIFAEIIFQSIDTKALTALEKRGLIAGTDFEIRRYVDDIFIFSKGEEISIKIHETYSDCLSKFNLSTNSSKTKKLSRPFLTEKSKIIREINISVNEFNEKFLSQPSESNKLLPKKIFRKEKLIHHFIDSIKSICLANEATYDDVSSYIISALFERTKKIINIEKELSQDNEHALKESCLVILETMAFFYSVSPSVSSSYKYCAAIILLNRFSEKFLPNYKHSIKQKAFSLSESLLTSDLAKSRANIDNFVFLEAINILLAISELGDEYLLPAATIEKFYTTEKSYYDIITTLFYIKSNIRYKSIRHRLIKEIDKKLRTNSDIRSDAEKACLFMDALSCPYISKSQKLKWIAAFYSDLKSALPSNQDIGIFFVESQSRYWFVNWSEIDLLNALEKKELKRSY